MPDNGILIDWSKAKFESADTTPDWSKAVYETPRQKTKQRPQGKVMRREVMQFQDPELRALSMVESSGGKHLGHAPHSKGDFHTAYGELGIKPWAAHDWVNRYGELRGRYGHLLADKDAFTREFKKNPEMYRAVARAHLARLKKAVGGDVFKAVPAWHLGEVGAKRAKNRAVARQYANRFKKFLRRMK